MPKLNSNAETEGKYKNNEGLSVIREIVNAQIESPSLTNQWTGLISAWKMNFNVDKYTVTHIIKHSRNSDYVLADQQTTADQQGDLRILINKDLKWINQVEASDKKRLITLG